jgi:hypothetical protein
MTGSGLLSGRRYVSGALLLVGILAPTMSDASQNATPPSGVGANFSSPGKSYKNLFQPQPFDRIARAQQRLQATVDAAKPRVVCGMTLIPADPKVDPKMVIEPKADQTRYTIRAIDPPICNSAPQ